MHFNKTISVIQKSHEPMKITHRTAVRAIIIEEGEILLVRSELGYYKLPGGGVEGAESLTEALLREVAEETGYLNCNVIEQLGTVSEQRPDHSAADSYFHMDSHHFLCELNNKDKTAQTLIGYELEEGYTPDWVSIQEAIDSNDSVYKKEKSKMFIVRENFVLDWLMQNFEILYSSK